MLTINCVIQFDCHEDDSFDKYDTPEEAEVMLHDALCRGFPLLRYDELDVGVATVSVVKDGPVSR